MRYIKGTEWNLQNTCVVFGYFDGVHLGHRAVLARAVAEAKQEGLTSVLLSFDRDGAPEDEKLLTTEAEKRRLAMGGPDVMISYPLDGGMEPARFMEEVLQRRLGAKVVVAGRNCAWLDQLRGGAARYGFRLVECDLACLGGEPITAGRVRAALAASDISLATALLGHPYLILGRVEHGKRLGSTVGMPTANISYPPYKLLPPEGVFGTRAVVDGTVLRGVTNIGRRPSVDNFKTITVESHLLDYAGDLYGRELPLEIDFFIRGIRKLHSLEEVRAQVCKDILFARSYPRAP